MSLLVSVKGEGNSLVGLNDRGHVDRPIPCTDNRDASANEKENLHHELSHFGRNVPGNDLEEKTKDSASGRG